MSSFRMAIGNIKKSVKDYVVYFVTLIIGVAIFYVFNSVGDQSVVKTISGSEYEMVELMIILLDGISVAVAFVLGFLIIYASNFLIRRRKKEFGIYMLLGMGKREVSKILISETFLIGVMSLVVGLGIGILSSQFVSILVGKFFEVDMSAYAFTVSGGAILKTVINFAVIYVVVLIFHSVTISKYKLIDLLAANKKTEKQVLKNPVISTIIFLASSIALGYAYYRVGFCSNELNRDEFITHIIIGVCSTILIFWSMSGFLLAALKKCKKLYNRNLNSFVIRQFCNSINTSAITMAIICLMLFVTICTFASGFSLAHYMQESMREFTPVDYTIRLDEKKALSQIFQEEGMPVDEWAADNMIELPFYNSEGLTWGSSIGDVMKEASEDYQYVIWETQEEIISLSDYNKLAALYGMEVITLGENEYAILCDFATFGQLRNKSMASGNTITVGDYELEPARSECIEGFIFMTGGNTNTGVIIVPDMVTESLAKKDMLAGYIMVGDFATDDKEEKGALKDRILEVADKHMIMDYGEMYIPLMDVATKITIIEASNGLSMMATFVVIYLGVVFLIASAALLALKALSESIDSTSRYEILKKIGSDHNMLRGALFAQIGVYFALPMVVAIIHSIIGLRFAQFVLSSIMIDTGIYWGVGVTAVVMILLYGGYMLATYKTSKGIVELEA